MYYGVHVFDDLDQIPDARMFIVSNRSQINISDFHVMFIIIVTCGMITTINPYFEDSDFSLPLYMTIQWNFLYYWACYLNKWLNIRGVYMLRVFAISSAYCYISLKILRIVVYSLCFTSNKDKKSNVWPQWANLAVKLAGSGLRHHWDKTCQSKKI